MESLTKYLPFIDFVLQIDQKKYFKFQNIKKWIMLRKNYPLESLNKIEQSIITQYKNLLIENNVEIPADVANIFAPMNLKQFINLCSDDEDDVENKKENINCSTPNTTKESSQRNDDKQQVLEIVIDSDDDLEIVSTEYAARKEELEKPMPSSKQYDSKTELDIDEISRDLLDRIDKMDTENLQLNSLRPKPKNYVNLERECNDSVGEHAQQKSLNPETNNNSDKQIEHNHSIEGEKTIYQRRDAALDVLFKRRTDFKDDEEVTVENLDSRKDTIFNFQPQTDIISLESDSEDEASTNVKGSSNFNSATLNKIKSKEIIRTNLKDKDTNSNRIGSNTSSQKLEMLCEAIESVAPDIKDILDELKDSNKPIPPLQPFYPAQQAQQQIQIPPPMMPYYHGNFNYIPGAAGAPLPRPKLNINDPRIKKQLQVITNSPLFQFNILDANIENKIRAMHQAQQLQNTQPHQQTNLQTFSAIRSTTPKSVTKSNMTFGEYKRRRLEQKLEMEKQKAKHNAKVNAEAEQDKSKLPTVLEEYSRSKTASTLSPCKEQLTTLCSSETTKTTQKSSAQMDLEAIEKENSCKEKTKTTFSTNVAAKHLKQKKDNNSTQHKNNTDQKLERIYKELQCDFRGFDQIQDYIYITREESLKISQETQSDTNSQTTKFVPKPIGLRRASSINALLAISEQLSHQQPEFSDSKTNQGKTTKRNAPTYSPSENSSQDPMCSKPKRRKTIDEIIKPSMCQKALRISDVNMFDAESPSIDKNTTFGIKEPIIKLRRLSPTLTRIYTKKLKANTQTDQNSTLKETCARVPNNKNPPQKKLKAKIYNNDCQMTERNTNVCVLCRSKPSDLTNHYIGRHKTESYVARLEWSELEDLSMNTQFAKLHPKTKNYRFDRYEVECPFCKEKLVDQFINLYNHYSAHTGEYAFQCSHCHLSKPYRPDIQSHILHSKTCRNCTIQVMYRYPPQAQCIYLHYCTICNFVQLNEANVLKHLREHHHSERANATNVQKCILAAMSDGPDAVDTNNLTASTPSPVPQKETMQCVMNTYPTEGEQPAPATADIIAGIQFKVDDDDIPVTNEPCSEDDEKYTSEEETERVHESSPLVTNPPTPMTIIHCGRNNSLASTNTDNGSAVTSIFNSAPVQRHVPIIIKTEPIEADTNFETPHPSDSVNNDLNQIPGKDAVYEKYRRYPANVNYLGLYKCMIDDCYYSTDSADDMYKHLIEHSLDELKPNEYLQCPYCIISIDVLANPIQLIEHMRHQHGHLNYQCSQCCYRSCDASNVHIHQQIHHKQSLSTCKIYKCSDEASSNRSIDVDKLIARNVYKLACFSCSESFYHTQFLKNHLEEKHKLTKIPDLKLYSCIYCPLTVGNTNEIRIHLATKHPSVIPLFYHHNKPVDTVNGDSKTTANVECSMAESVEFIEINAAACVDTKQGDMLDVKPDLKELLNNNEETVKVRLRKLTTHTGVPPDTLYRCSEATCGGFFSIFETWLRHMKVRHHTFECQCPHCPQEMVLNIEQFASHFERHRRHTFICFHCSTTSPSELLANEHAAQHHADLGTMRFEKIQFNIHYSYSIMIQNNLYKEREQFIAELLGILNSRLKALEENTTKNLKRQWPVRENIPWIDDYLQYLANRKVALRCLVKYCKFRTLKEDNLYRHLSTSHTINGTQFNCSKCNYRVENCNNLDELFSHIKLHNEYSFICTACSWITSIRSKISSHIQEQHSARDVPVIHIFRTSEQMYIKIYIVFSNNHLTFSTMKNCFCCSEQNLKGEAFSLHLKHYHKLSLYYHCEKCPNYEIKALNEVKEHFQQTHKTNEYKIRCELAGYKDLNVTSLNEFQVQILYPDSKSYQTFSLEYIKSEPVDNDIILLEDNDIAIKNALTDEQKSVRELPKIKCTSLSKLVEPLPSTSNASSLWSPILLSHLSAQLSPPPVIPVTRTYTPSTFTQILR